MGLFFFKCFMIYDHPLQMDTGTNDNFVEVEEL